MEDSNQTTITCESDFLYLTDTNTNADIEKEVNDNNISNSANANLTHTDSRPVTDNENEIPANEQPLFTAWDKLKPQYKDRLYYKILNSAHIPDTVHFWLIDYEHDKKRVTFELLQFFIDFAGYQFIDINNFPEKHIVIKLFNHMETIENPIYRQTGKYFLAYRNKSYFQKRRKIEEFMVNLVKKFILENDYFHSSVNKYCINFLKLLCKSQKRSIKHTGVFLALKYQRGLAEVLNHLEGRSSEAENDFPRSVAELKKISINIQQFVFPECCEIRDSCLVGLREDCVLEITNWIFLLPSVYLSERLLHYLLAFTVDDQKTVRLTTLKELLKIFEEFSDKLEKHIPKIVDSIGKRIYDIDLKVASLAVDILSFLYKCDNKWIPYPICSSIISRVYCSDYPFAAACGRFLIVMLQKQTTDDVTILQKIIRFEMRSNYKGIIGAHPLLVEAVMDAFPAMLDISLYKAVFDKIENDENELSAFVNILTEVFHQTMTGRSTLKRKNARKGAIDELDIFLIKHTLGVILPPLLKKNNEKIIKPLFLAYHNYFRK